MSSSSVAGAAARSGTRVRALLLGGTAICGVVVAADPSCAANFNVLPTQGAVDLAVAAAGQLNVKTLQAGAVTSGTVAYSSSGAAATVSLSAPRTLIDWTTFHVGAGNSLAFQFGSSASDIVINRVNTGAINVDSGGSVSGAFAGSTAGNIWFLAPNGVFINGTVTASGVLTSNNVGLADLNLLSDNVAALKGEISAAGALIDLTGVETTATGVAIDASGDIVLNGNIDTGAGAVNLLAKGTIAQTSGVITASSLSGSSAGGASLSGANQFDSLAGFTNTGSGDVSITDARSTGLLVSGTLTTVPNANLTLTASAGTLVLETPVEIGNGGSLVLSTASVLRINAPVLVDGAGSVFLSYNPASAGNLSINSNQFDGRIIYRTAGGLTAASSQGGGLTINNQSYTLLYQLANAGSTGPDTGTNDIAGIDANAAAGGDAGFYALATTVAGTGSSASPQFVSALVGSSGAGFTGTFEGLGNSIISLTIGDAVSGHNVGLFATNSGTIRDLGINNGSVSGGANSIVGMLVGQNLGAIVIAQVNDGLVTDTSGGSLVGGLAGVNGANGVIGGGAANGTVNGGVDVGGLVGVNQGQITRSTAKVQITGDANGVDLGGLVGSNTGTITQSASAGSVTGGSNIGGGVSVGGLVGSNTGTITQSLAAIAVDGGSNAANTGGLVGYDNGVVTQAGAQSAVTALGGAVGGLIGRRDSLSSVSEVYATGAVTGGALTTNLGPLVGLEGAGTPMTFGYFDIQTTGLSGGEGVGLTTAQSQGVLPTGFNTLGPAWNTGPGLYPYITAVFPGGVQAVSGTVYSDNGFTPMASGANGAIVVHLTVNGEENYAPLAGANGYYFGFVGAGRFAGGAGSKVLAWTTADASVGTVDAASAVTTTGTTTGLDIYPNVVLLPTTTTSLSALQATDPLPVAQYPTTPAFVSNLPIYVRAAGSGFDIDTDLAAGRDVTFETTAPGAAIRVDAPITLTGSGGSLTFLSTDALILNDDLVVPGGSVNLNAGAAITQTGGVITTSILTGSSAGGARLDGDNLFDLLSGFTNLGPGAVSITDAKSGGLIVVGLVDQGIGDALTLTASGGPLALDGPLVAQGGAINLSAAGPLAINSSITVGGAGAVSLISTPPVLTGANFGNGGALAGGGTLTYTDGRGVIATTDQGGSLSVNDVATPIIYGGAPAVMPIQGSVDLSVATGAGNLGATVLQGGVPSQVTVGYDSTGTTANINLTAPRTLIDWTTFEVGSGNTLNFNFGGGAGDIVVNRVTGGTINIDQGGVVNGLFGGQRGGNLWFLADGGVFIDGTATASGVLAGNNLLLTNQSLLTQDAPGLKTSLSNGFSMIDLVGSVNATGAKIDGAGNITLTDIIDTGAAGTVNLVSTGLIEESGGSITAATLTGASSGGAYLGGDNFIDTVGGFTNTGTGEIVITGSQSSGLTVTGKIDAGVGNTLILNTAAGSLTLAADLDATGGVVELVSSGFLTQTAGTITTTSLTALSTNVMSLAGSNQFDTLSQALTSSGSISITDAKPSGVTLTGLIAVNPGNSVTLTTANGGSITVAGQIIAPSGAVNLESSGQINEPSGFITGTTLTGSSVGGASLTSTNIFDQLGAFTNAGAGGIAITDISKGGLTVVGPVSGGLGNPVSLISTVGPLAIDSTLVDQAGQLSLFSASTLAIRAPIIVEGAGSVVLMSSPTVSSSSTFNNGGALTGGAALSYADSLGVAATSSLGGSLNINGQNVTILYSGGGGGGLLPAQGGVDLGVATSNGSLMATTLVGGAPSATTIDYTSTGTTANVALTAPRTLVDWTTFEVGGGDTLNFNFGGAASDIVINRVTTGAISLDAGGVVSGLFQGASGGNIWFLAPGGVFLNGTVTASGVLAGNDLGVPGMRLLSEGLTALKGELAGGFSLIDLGGTVSASGGAIDGSGNILLNGAVQTGANGAVSLISTGTIAEGVSGGLQAATLTGASVGGAALTGGNSFAALAGFTNSGGGDVSIADTTALALSGSIAVGASSLTLNTGGALTQTAGIITAATLTGSSVGGASLGGGNLIDTLSSFTNADSGSFSLTNAKTLAVTGMVDNGRVIGTAGTGRDIAIDVSAGGLTGTGVFTAERDVAIQVNTGALTLNSISAGDDIVIRALAVTANGTLTSTGAVSATENADTTAAGDTLVANNPITEFPHHFDTQPDGSVAEYGHVYNTAADGSHIDIQAGSGVLAITGAAEAQGSTGDVRLQSVTGSIQVAGVSAGRDVAIDARTSVTATGSLTALNSDVAVDARTGALTAVGMSAADDVALYANNGPLTVTGALTSGAGVNGIGSANYLRAVSFALDNGAATYLQADSIVLSGPGITARGGGINLSSIGTGALVLNVNLTTDPTYYVNFGSGSTVSQTGGVITTGLLTGQSNGAVSLTGANSFDTFGGFANTGAGDVSVVDTKAGGLTITAGVGLNTDVVDAGAGNTLTLTTTAGPLILATDISAAGGAVILNSAGSINQTSGAITATTLTSASHGSAIMTGQNQIATLAGFISGGAGDLFLTDANATGLTVIGDLNSGAGNLSLFTASLGAPLVLSANLSTDAAHTVSLFSNGTISQTSGVISAGALTGSSIGTVSLPDANLFGQLTGFVNTGAGAIGIVDAQAAGLLVNGTVSVGAGNTVNLDATGGPLTIAAPIVMQGGQLDLATAGMLTINAPITVDGAGAVVLSSTPAASTSPTFRNATALTGGATLTYADTLGVAAINNQGGSLTINGQVVGIAYPSVLPVQNGADLTSTTAGGSLAVSVVQGGSVTPSTAAFTSSGTTATVNLTAPRTLVDWTTFEVGSVDTLNFNFGVSASDVVINRVLNGAITVDAGGLVVGLYAGAPGGNVWFLAPGGVFLNGAVTASGVLAGNNIGLADTNLLSDPATILTGELARGATLIDLTGGVAVTGAVINASGDIVLGGDVNTGSTGAVQLVSSGTISQTGGIINTPTLSGSSVGGASLTDSNEIDVLTSFTNFDSGAFSLVNDDSLSVTGAVDNTAGAAGSGRDIVITLTSGDLTGAGMFNAARDVAINNLADSITFASAAAGNNLVLRTASSLSVTGALTATGADKGSDATDPAAAGAALVAARPISLFNAPDPALTGGDIDIQAGSATLSGSTMSGPLGGVRILSTSADSPLGPALNIVGPISAGADIALDATAGSIRVRGAQTAGRDLAARSVSGGVTLASVTAGDDIVLAAPGGAIVLNGTLTATGSASGGIGQTLFNTVSAPLDGLFMLGRQSIFVEAASYTGGVNPVTGRPSSLTASNAIGLFVADPAGLFLADARPDSGSWAAPATLSAPSVSLFESGGALNVRDASLGGALTTLNLYTGGQVLVTGVIAPSLDDTVNLTIGAGSAVLGQSAWTPSQIEVINDGLTAPDHGAIGSQTVSATGVYSSTPRTFHAASLYASNDILLGTQGFILANGSITDPSQLQMIDPNQPVPVVAANTSNAITLAIGDLSLAAGRLIVQQDTAGLMTTSGVGSYITRGLNLDSVGPNPPPAIDLFGVLVARGSTGLITGTAAAGSGQIGLSESLSLSPYRYLYRFNTCVINSISCSGVSTASGLPLDPTSQGAPLNLGGAFIDPGDAIGVLGGFGVVSRSSSRPSVAFSWLFVDGFVRYDETDVEDPTVTGAPNEEIWRRPD